MALGFQFWVPFFNCHVFQRNLHVLVIHDLVGHFVSDGKLLENRSPEKKISSLWPSI